MNGPSFWRLRKSDAKYLPLLFVMVGLMAALVAKPHLVGTGEVWTPNFTKAGTELVLVVVSSSTCSGARVPGFPEAIRAIRHGLRDEAIRKGYSFSSIGVSVDWSPQKGSRYLDEIGPFDEIMAGSSWLNSGAVKYLWGKLGGYPSTPQIIVLEREISVPAKGLIEVSNERVRYRKAGGPQIVSWSRSAFPTEFPGAGSSG